MFDFLSQLQPDQWAVIVATLLGPILAVQAQKAIEGLRHQRGRKQFLFEQLMATRAAKLAPEHVRALNMIDLVFYGKKTVGRLWRSTQEQAVLDAWKEYHDHLNTQFDDAVLSNWIARGDELFINLLFEIAKDIGFKFDRVQLKRGSYSPVAHGEIEAEQTELRKAALSLVTGKHALKMNVVGFPMNEAAVAENRTAIQSLGKALESGALRVQLLEDPDESKQKG